MALLHIAGAIASLAAASVFFVLGAIAWRDEKVFGGILFIFMLLQLVSLTGHVGGIR